MREIHVSDHAVLRYLERAKGIDVEAVRKHIAGTVRKGVEANALAVKVENVHFVLRGPVVVTVLYGSWFPNLEQRDQPADFAEASS